MGTVTKIFEYLIPIVILIVILTILFGGKGLFTKAKEVILGAKDLLPTVKVGLEEQKAEVTIPDVHREQIYNLKKTIEFMLGEGRENCFAKYNTFSEVGEIPTSLTFELRGDKTILRVKSGSGGKQDIKDLDTEFLGMKPCVIAGEGDEVAHFESYFLEGKKQLIYPYFRPVNSLTIFSTHKISASDLEEQDLDDNGYLFTPDGEYICFFPTGGDGIAEKEFTQSAFFSETSIPVRINEGKLQMCS